MALSFAAIQDALHRAVYHLQTAAGDDVFISQADVQQKLASLPASEQVLVNAMYQFLRAQERNPRGRVTLSDLEHHLPLIETQILPLFETESELNEGEFQALQRLGVPHVSLGNALKYTASFPPSDSPEAFARRLGVLAGGVSLIFYANSGHTVFQGIAVPYEAASLDGDTFLQALSALPDFRDWAGNFVTEREDSALPYFDNTFVSKQEPKRRTAAAEVVRLMTTSLTDLKIIVYNRDERRRYPTFIIGIMPTEKYAVGIWSGALNN